MKKKHILVTGGAGGIGLATADLFERSEFSVTITDVRTPIEQDHHLVKGDASSEEDVQRIVKAATDRFGPIDVLFINHGIGASADFIEGRSVVCQGPLDVNLDDFRRVMSVNLEGAVLFVKHAVPHMVRSEVSCIITSSSIWAYGKLPYAQAYTASKGGLMALSRSWAFHPDVRPIRSVALTLGAIDTPMLTTNPNGYKEACSESLLGRSITTEEVASVVMLIATNPAINATDIIVDGGNFNR
ncbi:SDR family oxidoreductase [Candidatus Kaiserbacteria bacterium]|nr:SDR family oxidoreductase [Candidatus Kaiserbacteria bacterium]